MKKEIEIFPKKIGLPINNFGLQQALKGQIREYCYGETWGSVIPGKKPSDIRIIFPSINKFIKAREAYFAWKNIAELTERLKEKPVYPEIIFERLQIAAYSDNPLILFIPWGFRTNGVFGEKEREAMNCVDKIIQVITKRKIRVKVILMPADVYAEEINNLPQKAVHDYFTEVRQEAENRGYQVLPWSEIRQRNYQQYSQLTMRYSDEKIASSLPPFVIDSAIQAATARGKNKQIAFAYLRERLCEAEIIEKQFEPVKLSMVSKNKDEGVDGNLPRLYVLPPELQFPWL